MTTGTVEDVALELAATRMALQQIIWTVSGTTSDPSGLEEWVNSSPVPLPRTPDGLYEEEFAQRLMARADAIELELMAAVGNFLLGTVRDRIDARPG